MRKLDDKGNVAITVALCMPLVLGGATFGVEVGFWRFDQVRLQQAADAASYAAAVVTRSGTGNATTTATSVATSNGYNSSTDTLTLTTPSPATPSDTGSIQVAISRTETPIFSAFFMKSPEVVSVASTSTYVSAGDACILALSKTASKAASFAGNSSISLNGCSVMSDSTASDALNVQGSASVTAPCLYSAGGSNNGGTTTLTSCTKVKTYQSPVADPYASQAMPPVNGNCTNPSNGTNLAPGNYCSLSVKNTVNLTTGGVYVINGGSLDVNAKGTLNGTGVTIYLVNGASMTVNGSGHLNLSAPTSGTYSGMLIINDRSNTGSITINGDSTSVVTGTIYSPDAAVNYIGNFSGSGGCTQIVALTVAWSGNTNFADNCSSAGMTQIPATTAVRLSA
jgi:Flp pilus assembly protein TadG